MSYDLSGKTALVTGASAGIGAAVARALAERGAVCGLLARRRGRLQKVADEIEARGGEAVVVPGDVTDGQSVREAVRRLREAHGDVDVLVNNAGTGLVARLEDTPVEEARQLFDINVLGMLRVLREVVPAMRRRGEGVVVQMSSASAIQALPVNGVYSATKAAVASLSDALRLEVEGTGVRVTTVFPVGTETEFLEASTDRVESDASGEFFSAGLSPVQEPREVAEAVADGIEEGRRDVFPHRPVRLFRALRAATPGLADALSGVRAYRDRVLGGADGGG